MSQHGVKTTYQVMPEHCMVDLHGGATEMRAACDAFFRRRGMNVFGGLAATINKDAVEGKARKAKREAAVVTSGGGDADV